MRCGRTYGRISFLICQYEYCGLACLFAKHRFQPEAIHTKGNVLYNHLLKPARLMFDYDHSHSGDRAKSLTEIAVTKCFVPLLKSDLAVTVEV
jgi:hypothetical protein